MVVVGRRAGSGDRARTWPIPIATDRRSRALTSRSRSKSWQHPPGKISV